MRLPAARRMLPALTGVLLLAGCTMAANPEEPPVSAEAPGLSEDAPPPVEPEPVPLPEPTPEPIEAAEPGDCFGALQQGGLIICPAEPGSPVEFGKVRLTAGPTGTAQFGLPRNQPLSFEVRRGAHVTPVTIEPREDEFRVVPGFDCDRIDARTPAQKAHAAVSWEKKQTAFALFHDGAGALEGFIPPSAARPSSPFGPTRKYVGVSKTSGEPCESLSVHQGYDMAAPVGTEVVAPAAGTVTLADPDLYYEGGTIFLDHGHGLLSVFMHLSEVSVSAGDVVEAGEVIARTGNTGRSTGPHLHWGVKWRNPDSNDRGADFYIDPALLLGLLPAD